MMSGLKTKELTIGGVSVVLASALPQQQMELYYLVYPYAERLYQEVDDVPKLTVDHLAKVLGFTGLETMQKIAALALSRTVKAGTSDSVTIADFENSIDSYHKLVSIAIEENLADFFTRLKGERADRLAEAEKKAKQAESLAAAMAKARA